MRPSWDEAKALQRSLPDGALTIATGEKEDGVLTLINLSSSN